MDKQVHDMAIKHDLKTQMNVWQKIFTILL